MKKDFEDKLIEVYKPIFDKYPSLSFLPVYSWGRFYKHECAGEDFESLCYDEYSEKGEVFSLYQRLEIPESLSDTLDFEYHEETFEKIDETSQMAKLSKDFPFQRGKISKMYRFDSRAGKTLVILKAESFSVEAWDSDSPE